MLKQLTAKLTQSPATLGIALATLIVISFTLGALLTNGAHGEAPAEVSTTSSEATMWTCSMHPQIQLPKSGQCPICFMDLIPVKTDNSSSLGPREIRMSETSRELAQIQTSPVIRGTAKQDISLYGTITTDKSQETEVVARVAGRVDSLYANFVGMRVKKGDPIGAMYSPELISAQKELQIAYRAMQQSKQGATANDITIQSNYKSAREKLRLYGVTESQINQFEQSQSVQTHVTILAETGGYITSKRIDEGAQVSVGDPIVTLADLSTVWVECEAYEKDLATISIGQDVSFSVRAFPGEQFHGTVTFIDPILDRMKRTGVVRLTAKNIDGKLKPNMLATATVHAKTSTSSDALLIPVSAALLTGERAIVYVEKHTEMGIVYEGREVNLGPRSGEFYVVTSGVNEGEQVVTHGAFAIDSELQLHAKNSMMNPDNGMSMVSATMQHNEHSQHVNNNAESKSPSALNQLRSVYFAYFEAQSALADDSLSHSIAAFQRLADSAKSIDTTLLENAVLSHWISARDTITSRIKKSLASDSPSIESLRDAFFYISNAMIELDKRIGHPGPNNHYVVFCPMARDGAGASWLQNHTTVDNSYWGAKMLKCGSIKDTISGQDK